MKSLFTASGKLKYCYNLLGHKTWFAESEQPIPAGPHQVRMEFAYDSGGIDKGGLATLFIDGQKVGSGRVEETHAMGFSADETCDVGREAGSPVSPDYGPRGNECSGEVNWVQIDLGLDDYDHLNADHLSPARRVSNRCLLPNAVRRSYGGRHRCIHCPAANRKSRGSTA